MNSRKKVQEGNAEGTTIADRRRVNATKIQLDQDDRDGQLPDI